MISLFTTKALHNSSPAGEVLKTNREKLKSDDINQIQEKLTNIKNTHLSLGGLGENDTRVNEENIIPIENCISAYREIRKKLEASGAKINNSTYPHNPNKLLSITAMKEEVSMLQFNLSKQLAEHKYQLSMENT